MNERLKELRNALGLSQKEFSQKINVGYSTLAMLETGQRNIRDIHVSQICREFGVNETWLRTGEGEMFVEDDASTFARLSEEYEFSDLERAFFGEYIKLPKTNRDAINQYLRNVVSKLNIAAEIEPELSPKERIDAELDAYRQELEAEEKGRMSSPSAEQSGAQESQFNFGQKKKPAPVCYHRNGRMKESVFVPIPLWNIL